MLSKDILWGTLALIGAAPERSGGIADSRTGVDACTNARLQKK